jgi:hypothetical protein
MDVRIGSIETTVSDSGKSALEPAQLQRIVKLVLEAIERQHRNEERAKRDRTIASPDNNDLEDYG